MNPAETNTPPVLEIRRYSNRRFYDPSRSKHVTLEEIRDMVQKGRDVRITEAKTGEDITSRTLTQIILEYEERKVSALPVAMLHRLIRSSESLWTEWVDRYLEVATGFLHDSTQVANDQWRRMQGMSTLPNEVGKWWQTWGMAPPPWLDPKHGSATPPGAAKEEDLRRIIHDLREQLNTVQDDLQALRKEGPAKK